MVNRLDLRYRKATQVVVVADYQRVTLKNCVEFESAQVHLKVHGVIFGDHLGLVKVSLMINYMNESMSSM